MKVKGFFYVYVGVSGTDNLRIGLRRGVWGWRSAAMDGGVSGMEARKIAQQIEPGDYVVLGHLGPNPRVPPGGWAPRVLKEVILAEATSALYRSEETVWPDDVYPERIGINVLERLQNVGGAVLGPAAMEALRFSANVGCVPILDAPLDVLTLEAVLTGDSPDDESDDLLRIPGDLDALGRAILRREQKLLRQAKFGDLPELQCDLCGRRLPRRFVRAAHIKRRAAASPTERRNLANVMAACLFGCDELFEHGYLYIDSTGRIQPNTDGTQYVTPDLKSFATALANRTCTAATPAAADFFTWHRAWATNPA